METGMTSNSVVFPAEELQVLEQHRKRVIWTKWALVVMFIALFIPFAYLLYQYTDLPARAIRYLSLPLIWVLYQRYRKVERAYVLAYGRTVSERILHQIRPQWTHVSEAGLPLPVVFATELIRKREWATSSNLIAGCVGDVPFQFCHVETSRKNSLAARMPEAEFRGYFFSFRFPKQIPTPVHVRARGSKDFGSYFPAPPRQKTDAAAFDNAFDTYCSDPVGMRYVLSLALMARMIDLQAVLPGRVSFLFEADRVHLALRMQGDTIEPKAKNRIDLSRTHAIHEDLFRLLEQFVAELRLEMDIWKGSAS